jgi:hypothetical protein
MKWNRIISFKEIRDMLGIPGSRILEADRWWDGKQIPHWRVENACGLARTELKYSFIDGWFPLPRKWECEVLEMRPRPRIRHCPQCVKFGYHSVVFYFEHISHCPWHREALQYCQQCSEVLLRKWPAKKGVMAAAETCQHLRIILDIVSPEEAPDYFQIEVMAWCDGLRNWVKDGVRLIGQAVYEVVVAVPSKLQDEDVVLKFLAGHASQDQYSSHVETQISMLNIPRSKLVWEKNYHNILRFPEIRIQFRDALRAMEPQAEVLDVISIVKSIRRYIFRRYIRRHRKCLSRLVRATTASWYTFNLDAICPCVVAYLIVFSREWDISPWDFLHIKSSHLRSYANRFFGLDDPLACESEVAMYVLIGNFYKMWSVLRHYREIGCRTLVLNYRYDGDRTSFVVPMIYETTRQHRYYIYWDAILFMENPDVVLARSIPDCSSRRRHPLQVRLNSYEYSLLNNNQNILCALHNTVASNKLRLNL